MRGSIANKHEKNFVLTLKLRRIINKCDSLNFARVIGYLNFLAILYSPGMDYIKTYHVDCLSRSLFA